MVDDAAILAWRNARTPRRCCLPILSPKA